MWHCTNNDDSDLLWQTQHLNMKVTKSARHPPHSVTNKTTDVFMDWSVLLCASCYYRLELDSNVDMYCTYRLLFSVRSSADVPPLSSFLSGHIAAQCSSKCSGRGQPASSSGPDWPQSAAAHALPRYKIEILKSWIMLFPVNLLYLSLSYFLIFCLKDTGLWIGCGHASRSEKGQLPHCHWPHLKLYILKRSQVYPATPTRLPLHHKSESSEFNLYLI